LREALLDADKRPDINAVLLRECDGKKWKPVFVNKSHENIDLDRDGVSTKRHHGLGPGKDFCAGFDRIATYETWHKEADADPAVANSRSCRPTGGKFGRDCRSIERCPSLPDIIDDMHKPVT